jgi:nicotinamide mononucleotide transporter
MSQKSHQTKKKSQSQLKRLSFIDHLSIIVGVVTSILTIVVEQENTPLYIVMSILVLNCGIAEIILGIKGRRSNYLFALFGSIGSIFIAFLDHFYGNMASNVFYVFVCIIGFYLWGKHSGRDKNVIARKLSPYQIAIVLLLLIIATLNLNMLLIFLNGRSTLIDSMSTVLIIFASILGVLLYREQGLIWIVSDTLVLIMWLETGNPAVIVMRIFLVIGSISGYVNWRKFIGNHSKTKE